MKNQQSPWNHASSAMPLSASEQEGMRAGQAGLLRENGAEDQNEENGAEMAFDGATNPSSIIVVCSQLCDV